MADVYCPRDRVTSPMNQCVTCKHVRLENDPSTIWCRFTIGLVDRPNKIKELQFQLKQAEIQMERYYKMGFAKKADNFMYRADKLRKELKKLKGENSSGN